MKIYFYIIALILLTSNLVYADNFEVQYVGYPANGGTPEPPIGSILPYGLYGSGDRIFTRWWTADEDGTANAINMYVYATWANEDYIYLCLYKGDTPLTTELVGQSVDQKGQTTAGQWTGWIDLIEDSPGSLDFVRGDTLYFGACKDEGAIQVLAYDDGDTVNDLYYDSTTTWSVDPPAIGALVRSSTEGLLSALRYKNTDTVLATNPESISSVTRHGVTWTFDTNYSVGQYINGDFWVLDPGSGVVISSMSPARVGMRHGWEVNPSPTDDMQGFDNGIGLYNDSVIPALPYTASGGDSIAKTISNQTGRTDTETTSCYVVLDYQCLDSASILTVVSSAPAGNGVAVFRPSYAGTDKTTHSFGDLLTDRLTNIDVTSTHDLTYSYVETYLERVQFDVEQGMPGRHLHPTLNFPEGSYTPKITRKYHNAMHLLLLDDTLANKTSLLIKIIQTGLDWYYTGVAGKTWPGGGGHTSGVSGLIAFTAYMFDDPDMKQLVADYETDGLWHENWLLQTNSAGLPLWGRTEYQTEDDYWEFLSRTTSHTFIERYDPYGYIDGAVSYWAQINEYQKITSTIWKASAVLLKILPEIRDFWPATELVKYTDRWVNLGFWSVHDPCAGVALVDRGLPPEEWTEYGVTWGKAGDGTCIEDGVGRLPERHGGYKDATNSAEFSQLSSDLWDYFDLQNIPCTDNGDNTWTAGSCHTEAIQDCLDQPTLADGDVINVPEGVCEWEETVTINDNITLIGAGAGETIVYNDYTDGGVENAYTLHFGPNTVDISEFTFLEMYVKGYGQNFRVHDNIFYRGADDDGTTGVEWSPLAYIIGNRAQGLVDHNQFHNGRIVVYGGAFAYDDGNNNSNKNWAIETLFGSGDDTVYIEDNVYTRSTTNTGNAVDGNVSGQYVFRYNTLQGTYVEAHSMQGENRSHKKAVVYGNILVRGTQTPWQAVHIRGGSGLVFNNAFEGSWYNGYVGIDNKRTVGFETAVGICRGSHPMDGNTSGGGGNGEDGVATGGSGITMINSGASWATDEWAGFYIHNTSEYSTVLAGCVGLISSNDGTTATVSNGFGSMGTHQFQKYSTAYDNYAYLLNLGESWTADGLVGTTLYNVTDGSSCVIESNTSTAVFCTLAGGTNNLWNSEDVYLLDTCTGNAAFDDGEAYVITNGYPCRDQPGSGHDATEWVSRPFGEFLQSRQPIYTWSNTCDTSANPECEASNLTTTVWNEFDVTPGHMQADRDFYEFDTTFDGSSGVGCGPLGSRPSSCTSGVAYWATDQSCTNMNGLVGEDHSEDIEGVLWKCTNESWEQYFTPYTYPHPLQAGLPSSPLVPHSFGGGFTFGGGQF